MANTVLRILHEYTEFIHRELVDADYKLAKAPPLNKQGIEKPCLVIPAVTTGNLPHANFSLYGAENEFFQAPYIMIGFDENASDYENSSTQLLIQTCCYPSESYVNNPQDPKHDLDIPDNKAYEDVINLLEWLKDRLLSVGGVGGTTIEKPVKLGSYNTKELTYPYSFGYLSFQINSVSHDINRNKINY